MLTEILLHITIQARKRNGLGRLPESFPIQKRNMPIELHQDIHNVYFAPNKLNIVRGAVERNPIHNTVYRLTLNG